MKTKFDPLRRVTQSGDMKETADQGIGQILIRNFSSCRSRKYTEQ